MKAVSCSQRNGGHRLCAQEAHRALLSITFVIMFPSEEYRRAMEQGLCSQPSLHQVFALAPPVAREALSR